MCALCGQSNALEGVQKKVLPFHDKKTNNNKFATTMTVQWSLSVVTTMCFFVVAWIVSLTILSLVHVMAYVWMSKRLFVDDKGHVKTPTNRWRHTRQQRAMHTTPHTTPW